MRNLIGAIILLLALSLAGCVDSEPAGDGHDPDHGDASDSQGAGSPSADGTFTVAVEAAHAVSGAARTITVKVSQEGEELGTASYTTQGKETDVYELILTVTAQPGVVKLQAFEGDEPLNFKSIDPANCPAPKFSVHIIDSAVHLLSNCD